MRFETSPAPPPGYLPVETPRTPALARADERSVAAVVEYVKCAGYTYQPWQIATLVTALKTKPFVILAGISGTGKTRLPQLVAQATSADVSVVPVRPDWTDSSDLLGYTDLGGTFQPGHLLRLCKTAMNAPDRQFLFILDEMNVAKVEYYFAEVLSLIENRFWDGDTIKTEPLVPNAPGSADGWESVFLPGNVSVVGTVNMDETTHSFSRKVLDRAFVLELSDVDLAEMPTAQAEPSPAQWSSSDWQPGALRLAESADIADPVVTGVVQALNRANESLSIAQLQVGYRVRDELALFCLNARLCAESFVEMDETLVSPLDIALSMKVLPRIQGGGTLIRQVLADLANWAGDSAMALPRTSDRIKIMQQRLESTGFTTYWI